MLLISIFGLQASQKDLAVPSGSRISAKKEQPSELQEQRFVSIHENKNDLKKLIISWHASDGSQPIVDAMNDWEIDIDDFLDLPKDPKGIKVGTFSLIDQLILMNFSSDCSAMEKNPLLFQ